jgi:predicted nuclease with TOPRIM domain
MQYFRFCKTLDDVKRLYREWANKLHPDHGGNKDDMIDLNKQYEKVCEELKNPFTRSYTMSDEEKDEYFKKGQQAYHARYGGYQYRTNNDMRSEFARQSHDPRIADYERMKEENRRLRQDYLPLQNENIRLNHELTRANNEINSLKKKLEKLKKSMTKVTETKTKKRLGKQPVIFL